LQPPPDAKPAAKISQDLIDGMYLRMFCMFMVDRSVG